MRTTARRRVSGAGFVLENLEGGNVEQVGLDIDADEQHGDGADAALLEMQEATSAAAANDGAVDELENTVAALESLLETAEASQETGGLDPVAAELLQKAVENETAPLGTPAEDVAIPALENFRSASSRRQATVMACEGIKEWIDKFWAKIKELIQKGRDLAKKAYIAVKQAVQGLERRVKGLKEDHAKRNFSLPKAGNVSVDTSWDPAKVGEAVGFVDAVLNEYSKAAIEHAKAIASGLGAGDAEKVKKEAGKEGESGDAKGEEKKEEFKIPPRIESAAAKILKFEGAHGLPGGRAVISTGDTISIRTANAKAMDTQGNKAETKPLSGDEIGSLLTALEGLAKQVVAYEKNFQEKDRAEETVTKAGDEFAKKIKSNDKGSDGDARAALNAARDAARLLNQPIKDTLSYAATAINAYCNVAAASLKMYDKK